MSDTFPILKIERRSVEATDPPSIVQFHDMWQQWCAGRWAPAWRDVDLMSVPPRMVRYVVVCDVLPDNDFFFRFWGSGHAAYHNVDYSQQKLSELVHNWTIDALRTQYQQVVDTKAAWLFHSTYEDIEQPLPSFRAPLSNDGENVTGLICYVPRQDIETELRAWHYDPD